MTILYTEISQPLPRYGRQIFFLADRRITPLKNERPRYCKKLVEIPYLNAALGFFGLAEFVRNGRLYSVAEHLRSFVTAQHDAASLSAFAARLASSLTSFVPYGIRTTVGSGVHVAGFRLDGLPEFWFVRNVDDSGNATLVDYRADEQYLGRDARSDGFDGVNANTLPRHGRIYRNGDILPHAMSWTALDESLGAVLGQPGYPRPTDPRSYEKWILFKMKIVKDFHRHFQDKPLIGGKLDTIVLRAR